MVLNIDYRFKHIMSLHPFAIGRITEELAKVVSGEEMAAALNSRVVDLEDTIEINYHTTGDDGAMFYDWERREYVTERDLFSEYVDADLTGDTEADSFAEYVANCLEGSLVKVTPVRTVGELNWLVQSDLEEEAYTEDDISALTIRDAVERFGLSKHWLQWAIDSHNRK